MCVPESHSVRLQIECSHSVCIGCLLGMRNGHAGKNRRLRRLLCLPLVLCKFRANLYGSSSRKNTMTATFMPERKRGFRKMMNLRGFIRPRPLFSCVSFRLRLPPGISVVFPNRVEVSPQRQAVRDISIRSGGTTGISRQEEESERQRGNSLSDRRETS